MLDKGSNRPARLLEVNPAETRALAARLASDGLIDEAATYLARAHVAEAQIAAYHALMDQAMRYAKQAEQCVYHSPDVVPIARNLFDELVELGWSPPALLEQSHASQQDVDDATRALRADRLI